MKAQLDLPETSRAAVVTAFNEPLEIWDLPIPQLEPGALLVKIDAATICGSDVHLWDSSLTNIRPINLPVLPGHEMSGTIVAFGEGDRRRDSAGAELDLGDRIVFTQARCGKCFQCAIALQPNLCENRLPYGDNCEAYPYLVGSFSEYCYVYPTSRRIKVPDSVKSEWASAASCALRTVVNSFERTGTIEPWQTVVIQGSGPLGLFATAMATRLGVGRIIVIGDPDDRLAVATAWGATEVVSVSGNPTPEARIDAVRALTGGVGADLVMEFSGARTAVPEGVKMLRRGGRYTVVGQVGAHEASIQPTDIQRGHLSIIGSFSATESHYWKALKFLEITQDEFDFDLMFTKKYSLDDVTRAYADMRAFDVIKPVLVP